MNEGLEEKLIPPVSVEEEFRNALIFELSLN